MFVWTIRSAASAPAVAVDYKVSGIGSGSCGPQLLEKYRMQDENVKFEFSIVKL